jgi:hypothetical protein
MKRNLRVLALILAVFAALSFGSASVASAQAHHTAPANGSGNGNGGGNNGNGKGNIATSTTQASNNQPQPFSNADQNGNGANPGTNTTIPYLSTRNGDPSLNGNGNGKSVGKPCAGCVGKADNKNPPGQQPGGSDHNAGYECDRNNGIGKSNPAHTLCASSSSVPTTTTTLGTTTTTTVPVTTTSPPTTSTGGGGQTGTTAPTSSHPAPASASAPATAHQGSLAFTGLDSRLIALGALALVLAGLMIFFASQVTGRRHDEGGTAE